MVKHKSLCYLLALLTACSNPQVDVAPVLTLSIVGTNDLHGAMINEQGGIATFGGYIGNLRAARVSDGGSLLLFDAGDMWQGTLESNLAEGRPVVQIYNHLGYAAAALGNHEFDFGPVGEKAMPHSPQDDPRGALKRRAIEADFPFLAANLIDSTSGEPVAWENVFPSTIVEASGLRVGVIGIMSSNSLYTTIASNVTGLRLKALAQTVSAEARRLRSDGVDLVIVAAHAGGRCTEFENPLDLSSCSPNQEIFGVARELSPGEVDVIFGGHVHHGIAHSVNGISILSSYSRGTYFGRIDLQIDSATGQVVGRKIFEPQRICEFVKTDDKDCAQAGEQGAVSASYEGATVTRDQEIEKILQPVLERTASVKAELLGPVLQDSFERQPYPESAIGNMMTDILLGAVDGADVAMHNTVGGIRADLPEGALTYGSIYEMFPFDNRLTLIHMTGAELRQVLAHQLTGRYQRGHFAGIRVTAACHAEQLAIDMTDRNGNQIQDDDVLLVVSNDFLAEGGDGVFTPVMPEGGYETDPGAPLVRDLIVDWMRAHGGSISSSDFYSGVPERWNYPGTLPLACSL